MKQPNKNDYFIDVDGTGILPYDKAYRAYKQYADDLEDYINHLKQAKNNEVLDLVSKRGDLDLSIENLVLKSTECNHKWERLDRNRIVCGECSEIQSRTL